MKQTIGFCMVLMSVCFTAMTAAADSFIVIRDGREYLCKPHGSPSPGDPTGRWACAVQALRLTFLSRSEVIDLCDGAWSEAPALCAGRAANLPFSKPQLVDLCRQATNDGPAACAEVAYRGLLAKEDIVILCRRYGRVEHAQCAIQAIKNGYSRDEALRLCKASASSQGPNTPTTVKSFDTSPGRTAI